jgi:hypothetical protein
MISTHDYITDVTPEQAKLCELTRTKFKEIETLFRDFPFSGDRTFSDRCLNKAKTDLETACMFAIKGIVFAGKDVNW